MLASLGYVAMAVDIYGDGKIAATPDSAKAFAGPFYMHPEKAKARIDAAIAKLRSMPEVDSANIGAVGYCFGGGVLLNTARLGDDLKGIVSFHGSLLGTPAKKELLHTKILVCHGNADKFVSAQDVATFKKQMDSIGASYTFIGYDSATHAFTNPDATANGKKFNMPIEYNAKADSASWSDMKTFFTSLFK
jgi:dienelactone hydrolase